MADSSRVALRYALETTRGTTPATAGKTLRVTSIDPKFIQEYRASQEIRTNRTKARGSRTALSGAVGFGFEFSPRTFDEILELGLMSSWAANAISNGTTLRSATLELNFPDTTPAAFIPFKGAVCQSLSLSIAQGEILTGKADFVANPPTPAATTAFTGTPVVPTTTPAMNAVDNVTLIQEGGSTITTVLGIEINLSNNVRPDPVVGSANPFRMGLGQVDVTGSLRIYFDNLTHYNKLINNTNSSLSFRLEAGGDEYVFTIPNLTYQDGNPNVSGNNVSLELPLSFEAFDGGNGKVLEVVRTLAP
jgi:hypothetical protein